MRFIDARIHGVLDIVIVFIFLLAPLVLGLGGSPAAISYILAVVYLVMTLLTDYPMGIRKTIPFFVHGIVELIVAENRSTTCGADSHHLATASRRRLI